MEFYNTDFGRVLISTAIPAIVSIIGFVVTFKAMDKSFKGEIRKQKSNIALEKMATVPYDVLLIYDHMLGPATLEKKINSMGLTGKEERNFRAKVTSDCGKAVLEMRELQNTVYSYGSKEAILLLAELQKIIYSNQDNLAESENDDMLVAYFILLANQIRYDVTGEAISPLYWYEINISDFDRHKEKYIRYNNEIVKRLSLNKGLVICCKKTPVVK